MSDPITDLAVTYAAQIDALREENSWLKERLHTAHRDVVRLSTEINILRTIERRIRKDVPWDSKENMYGRQLKELDALREKDSLT